MFFSPFSLPFPDESIPPVGTQPQRDGIHKSSWVPAAHRFKNCRSHHRAGLSIRLSLPAGHEYRKHRKLYHGCVTQIFLIGSRFWKQIGFGWLQGAIGDGQRSSSATTYVGPNYINRSNLHILLHAHATKLLEATGPSTATPSFNGVEFGTGPSSKSRRYHDRMHPFVHKTSGQRWKVTARKEVILSAGVFNTPQLLMLSGIGDSAELAKLGIQTRVNLPSVGKNMTDHASLINPWRTNSNESFDTYLSSDVLPGRIQEWNQTHKGPLSWTVATQMAWVRLPPNDTIIQTYGDPSPGPTSSHLQFIWANGWVSAFPEPEGTPWMTIVTNVISPTSRKCFILFARSLNPSLVFWTGGEVKLRSLNPFDPPIVNPNFLSTDFDIKTMVAAVKLAKRFMSAQAWKGFVGTPWEPLASSNTDEEIAQYARNHSATYVDSIDFFPSRI